jgi:hypothetical protein
MKSAREQRRVNDFVMVASMAMVVARKFHGADTNVKQLAAEVENVKALFEELVKMLPEPEPDVYEKRERLAHQALRLVINNYDLLGEDGIAIVAEARNLGFAAPEAKAT